MEISIYSIQNANITPSKKQSSNISNSLYGPVVSTQDIILKSNEIDLKKVLSTGVAVGKIVDVNTGKLYASSSTTCIIMTPTLK